MDAHILIVESDSLIATLLSVALTDVGYATTVLHDPRRVVEFLEGNTVDLVLLDVTLPYIDGFTLCATFRRHRPDIAVVFITARHTVTEAVAAFDHGADDYIAQPVDAATLIARVRSVLHRCRRPGRAHPDAAITVGQAALDLGTMRFSAPARPAVLLTPTEMKILECLMRNAHAILPRETLLGRLRDGELGGDSNRLDVYIRRLRKKIEADPESPRFIQTVRGLGYVFRDGGHAA